MRSPGSNPDRITPLATPLPVTPRPVGAFPVFQGFPTPREDCEVESVVSACRSQANSEMTALLAEMKAGREQQAAKDDREREFRLKELELLVATTAKRESK